MWMKPKTLTRTERVVVYFRMFLDCSTLGKKYIIGGSNVEKVKKHRMTGSPYMLWQGTTSSFGKPQKQWVYYTPFRQVWHVAPRAIIARWSKEVWRDVQSTLKRDSKRTREDNSWQQV